VGAQANTGEWNGLIALVNRVRLIEYNWLKSSGTRPGMGEFVEAKGVRCSLHISNLIDKYTSKDWRVLDEAAGQVVGGRSATESVSYNSAR
jgi:hypothetical protein